jgi:hypothetical protein
MDASAFEPVVFTLTDGIQDLAPLRDRLCPKAYHETSRSSSSHTFSWTKSGKMFVQTDLSELEEQIKAKKSTSQTDTLRSAKTQIQYWEATIRTYRDTW